MTVGFRFVVVATAAAAVFAIAVQHRALRTATGRLDRADERLVATADAVSELAELRARDETVSTARRPDRDVIARVNAALDAARLERSYFRNQIPEADVALPTPAGAPPRRRQAVRLSLGPLTAAELGAFLSEWRTAHSVWTPIAVDLTHRPPSGAGARGSGGGGGRYDVTIVIAAMYVDLHRSDLESADARRDAAPDAHVSMTAAPPTARGNEDERRRHAR